MKKSKKIALCLAQIAIIALFIVIAAGSASEKELASFATGYSQGYSSGSKGYSFIGQYSSESACKSACSKAGYTNAYEYYPSTSNCFCK